MEVYFETADERLARELTLLLPEGYTRAKAREGALVIADADTANTVEADIVIARKTREGDFIFLKRPFPDEAFMRALFLAGKAGETPLTPTEQKLFSILKAANGAPVSREVLLREVWGEGAGDGLLNLYIHYLREKLEKDGKRRIFASRGKGYFYQC